MTRRDPIVEEVRKHREAIARELGSIEDIVAAFQREEATDGIPSVSFPPKRIAKRAPRSSKSKKTRTAAKRVRSAART
jgi:hypothetical protein